MRLCLAAVALVAAHLAGASSASAAGVARIPDAQAREYLRLAKTADLMADPLERCLAFPALPGAAWPAGLAERHCRNEFGPRLTASELGEMLRSKAASSLDQRFAQDLARHAAHGPGSEAIHHDFEIFDGSQASDEMSQAWLALAPESAFALVGRASHLRRAIDRLRAGRFADQVTQAEFTAMSAMAGQSLELYQRALEREPLLVEAYVGIINVARLDGRGRDHADAVKQGRKLDPACHAMAAQVMTSLSPQWGGSRAAMEALATELEDRLGAEPLLALVIGRPRWYAAALAMQEQRYVDIPSLVEPVVSRSTEPFALQLLAGARQRDAQDASLDAVVYAVAASRFAPRDADLTAMRGALLLSRLDDAAWAVPPLEQLVAAEPENGIAQQYLATAYARVGRTEDAVAHFTRAMAIPASRDFALRGLTRVMASVEGEVPRSEWIAPEAAIREASRLAPLGVPGAFIVTVVASGAQGGTIFLNSHPNYRDPGNLTVALQPDAVAGLTQRMGADPRSALAAKTVLVLGVVRRVPIYLTAPDAAATPAYYQTHVEVIDAAQLRIVAP